MRCDSDPPWSSLQFEASNVGALRSLDSSTLSTKAGADKVLLVPLMLPPVELLPELEPPDMLLWLNSCHGTGIIRPVMPELDKDEDEDDELEELLNPPAVPVPPDTLDRLEGTVSFPEVEVSAEPVPLEDKFKIANPTRPDCGSIVKSRTWPSVLPSCDWTGLFSSWLMRTLEP